MAMPTLDDIIRRNPINKFLWPQQTGEFAKRAKSILDNRMKQGEDDIQNADGDPTKKKDFVSRFLEVKEKDPKSVSTAQLVGYVMTNLVAGSDTTAIAMRTALYHVLKNPKIRTRMREELDSANVTYPVSYKTCYYDLPYNAGVVKEALRLHFPIIGLMERRVPDGQELELPCGKKIPGGTVIGMLPDLIGRDKEVFGQDADDFNPERWLQRADEPDEAFKERLKVMKASNLSFGHGPRACLGQHVAELELYKFVPTIMGLMDVSIDSSNEENRH